MNFIAAKVNRIRVNYRSIGVSPNAETYRNRAMELAQPYKLDLYKHHYNTAMAKIAAKYGVRQASWD